MDQIERDAINIVRGEQNGDTFVWQGEWEDEKGVWHIGGWASDLKKRGLIEDETDPDGDGLR